MKKKISWSSFELVNIIVVHYATRLMLSFNHLLPSIFLEVLVLEIY